MLIESCTENYLRRKDRMAQEFEDYSPTFTVSAEAAKHYISAFTAYDHFCNYIRPDRKLSRARTVASYFRRKQKDGRTSADRYVTVSNAIFQYLDGIEKSRQRARRRFESLEGVIRMRGVTHVQFTEAQMRFLYAMMEDDDAIEADEKLARRVGYIRQLGISEG